MKRIYIIITLTLFYSCANIQAPTGGIKDVIPPKLENSIPADRTLNFHGKDISLRFNEDIIGNNIQEQLQITPAVESSYKVKLRRKEVIIRFDKDFEPNTTYTLNFRNSIQDITEKNISKNLVLSFSTGSYMDSIQLNGKVIDIKTNLPIENASVELYNAKDTSGIRAHKPMYFTQTDKSGGFEFKNLKNTSYNIFAITDKNKDLMYQEGEKIGWIKNKELNKNVSDLKITVFTQDTKAPILLGSSSTDTKYEIRFNEGVAVQKVNNMMDSSQTVYYSEKENGKSLYIYNTWNIKDSIPIFLSVKDSTGNLLEQKIKIGYNKKTKDKEKLQLKYEPADKKLEPGKISIKLLFNKPIKTFNRKTIILDQDTTKLYMTDTNYTWNNTYTELMISRKMKQADTVTLYTFKESFISANNDSLMDQKIQFKIAKEEDYGIISGSIETKETNYILELLDMNIKVVKELNNPKKFKFVNLKPGEYSLRVIID
ncbi:MAG TPA: Ig-like domain-containing protein, partial [Cytophagaceae bacterium]|nr:Ig-like domain-containing protein [Cytophagaceae bacterium]